MRRGGKSLHHFLFHTSRRIASNIFFFFFHFIPVYLFCIGYVFFFTIIMNIDRYGRLGISDGDCISSLCVSCWGVLNCLLIYALSPSTNICVDLSVYTVLIMCFFPIDWVWFCVSIALDILFMTFYIFLLAVHHCRWIVSFSLPGLLQTKKFTMLIRLVSPCVTSGRQLWYSV
jgi:hypothetical protein